MAARHLRRERREHSLQPTALVHEVYLRVAGAEQQDWRDRAHFFGVAAQLMRQILVDHAREYRSLKRGGDAQRIEFEEALVVSEENSDLILEIDRAIGRLAQWDARQARIVEMRYFSGLTEDEIAEVLKISVRTVKRDWSMAKAWLHGVLTQQPSVNDA